MNSGISKANIIIRKGKHMRTEWVKSKSRVKYKKMLE